MQYLAKGLVSPPEFIEAIPASSCLDDDEYVGTRLSPRSPLETGSASTAQELPSYKYSQDIPKSPTAPWEQTDDNQVFPTPNSPSSQNENLDDPQGEVTAVDPPQEHEATPSKAEAVPASRGVEEVNASAGPSQLERTIEIVTFKQEEIGAFHGFLGRIIPTSAAGFEATALYLACQLHEYINEYVDNLSRRRFERDGFDPNRT